MSIDFLINRKEYHDEILSIYSSNGPQTVPQVSAKTGGSFLKYSLFKTLRFSNCIVTYEYFLKIQYLRKEPSILAETFRTF